MAESHFDAAEQLIDLYRRTILMKSVKSNGTEVNLLTLEDVVGGVNRRYT